MSDAPEEPIPYAVRLSERALRDIDLAFADYLDATGDEARSLKLRYGLRQTAESLNENPARYAIAGSESAAFGFPVRRVLYRLTRGSGVAYHLIYYAVRKSPDGPTVSVLHVRHASRAPLTTEEASEIKGQQ